MDEAEILARTIYGEARGEYLLSEGGMASLIAVGNVVMNRLEIKSWYGKTVREICLKPWQFSCWNENDPNRQLLLKPEIFDPVFSVCRQVAIKVLQGQWPDLTRGSDHYHAITMAHLPGWAKGARPKARLARHIFYRLQKGG